MERWLTHKMKIKILYFSAKPLGKEIKLLCAHKLLRPRRLVAKRAGKIADIRDLQISLVEHFTAPFRFYPYNNIIKHAVCQTRYNNQK